MKESTNPNPDLYPFWAEPEDLRQLTSDEKRREWISIFLDQTYSRRDGLRLFRGCGADAGKIFLGWLLQGGDGQKWVVLRALVQKQSRTIVAIPLRRESLEAIDGVDWMRPCLDYRVWENVVDKYRVIVPSGVF